MSDELIFSASYINVLIVEDNEAQLVNLIETIKRAKEYTFKFTDFSSGKDAIEHLATDPVYDVIIVDIGLTDGIHAGLDVIKEARARDRFAEIIVVTVLKDWEIVPEAMDFGARLYLNKDHVNYMTIIRKAVVKAARQSYLERDYYAEAANNQNLSTKILDLIDSLLEVQNLPEAAKTIIAKISRLINRGS